MSKCRDEIMADAHGQRGVRYWTMHCGPRGSQEEGFGCAMFVCWLLNKRYGTDFYGSCWHLWGEAIGAQVYNQGGRGMFYEVEDPKPGDIVLYFRGDETYASTLACHAALYAGGGMVIGSWGANAPGDWDYYAGRGVSYDPLEDQSLGGTHRFIRCKLVAEEEQAEKGEPMPTPVPDVVPVEKDRSVYRLYNPTSGDHLLTVSHVEAQKVADLGWRYEGVAWIAPTDGDINGEYVYRLYNPSTEEHLLTTDSVEYGALRHVGWKGEGVCMCSGGNVKVYRLYDTKPNGKHMLTKDPVERKALLKAGWKDEGVSLYAEE